MHRLCLSPWLLPVALLIVLAWPKAGGAFPIKEWDKLDVDADPLRTAVDVQAGKPWKESLSGITFVWIPGGCFKMGSPPNAEGRDADEEPLHSVCLSGFWLGEREVTQQQWQRVMQHNPSQMHHEIVGQRDEAFPVENISRLDVETFIAKLNQHHQGQVTIQLPTEAQWEYACRNAGEKVVFPGYGQVDQMGWYRVSSNRTTQMTGTRAPNRLGLYDMSGNVWEWVRDTYDKSAYGQHDNNDPLHTGDSPFSVIRGGGWKDTVEALRCANRGFERLTSKRPDLGLRLAAGVNAQAKPDGKPGQQRSTRSKMPF
ncbi:MAG: formylglycine-generating enzyme family protein [Magnetococcus sp. DMHC-8]